MRRPVILLACATLFAAGSLAAGAAASGDRVVATIHDDLSSPVDFTPFVGHAFDTARTWTLADAASPVNAPRYDTGMIVLPPWARSLANLVVWERVIFATEHQPPADLVLLAPSLPDTVAVYRRSRDGGFTEVRGGSSAPIRWRAIPSGAFVIPYVPPAPSTFDTLYIRTCSMRGAPQSLNLGVTLEARSVFERDAADWRWSLGVYAGVLLLALLINLLFGFILREWASFMLCGWILGIGMTTVLGSPFGLELFEFATPQAVIGFTNWVIIPLQCIAIAAFMYVVMELRTTMPRTARLFFPLALVQAMAIAATNILSVYVVAAAAASLATIAVVLWSAVIMAVQAVRGSFVARVMVICSVPILAWAIVTSSNALSVLVPALASPRFSEAAVTVQILGFSWLSVHKVMVVRRASRRAIEEHARLVKEQNVMLERTVAERTVELRGAVEQTQHALEDLQHAQAQLVQSEKMASLGELTAGIAHEINNPVNFISASIGPLRRDLAELLSVLEACLTGARTGDPAGALRAAEAIDIPYTVEEVRKLLRSIETGATRSAEIVRGLRTFAHSDEREVKLVDVHEGLDATLTLLQSRCRDRITIVREYGDLPRVECFAGPINQVFMNLLANAVDAISGDGEIRIRTERLDANVTIVIRDTGSGMTDDVMARIFDPFFTTKDVGKGTGLGLAITFGIIHNHHGTIAVSSTPGAGTAFTVTLPIVQPAEPG